jgi:hypothetical protein
LRKTDKDDDCFSTSEVYDKNVIGLREGLVENPNKLLVSLRATIKILPVPDSWIRTNPRESCRENTQKSLSDNKSIYYEFLLAS